MQTTRKIWLEVEMTASEGLDVTFVSIQSF
jgi:hypothetical protein